jgi:hypothetical protein
MGITGCTVTAAVGTGLDAFFFPFFFFFFLGNDAFVNKCGQGSNEGLGQGFGVGLGQGFGLGLGQGFGVGLGQGFGVGLGQAFHESPISWHQTVVGFRCSSTIASYTT